MDRTQLRGLLAGDDEGALLDLGCDLADAGRQEEAAACFRRADELGSAIGSFNLGNTLRDLGRPQLAVAAYQRALAGGEDDAWLNLGLLLVDLGDAAGGMAAFRSGASAGAAGCALALAFELRAEGELDLAERALVSVVAAGDQEASAVLACWQWCRTWDPTLETELRAGSDLFPSARADLADLLVRTDRADEALAVLRRGVEHGEVECMLALGNLHWDAFGDVDAAESAYRGGAAAGDVHCRTNLALLLWEERDDRDAAEAAFRQASADGDTVADQHLQRGWGG